MTAKRRTVGILIFNDVEVLDFCGPFEVFSVARPVGLHDDEARLFDAVTVAETAATVSARRGLKIEPDYTIKDHPPLDILVVPGGRGTRKEMHNKALLAWIEAQDSRTELTTSVCTGAFLLAELGLLNGKRATTHWGSVQFMRETYQAVNMKEEVRFVDEGRIVTSAGISAGIDMSLHIVARLHTEM
jgi:transcriptional regulator GlxA family with amidase domain